jgi:hypothetical protein
LTPVGPLSTASDTPNCIVGRVVYKVGGRQSVPQPRGSQSSGCNRFPRVIQLPPLNSPKDGPQYKLRQHQRAFTTYCIRLAGGGYLLPVTPRGGYWLGLAPKCLRNNDSHRPLIHRLHQGLPSRSWQDFRHPS